MSTSSDNIGFAGVTPDGVWQFMDQLRSSFEKRAGSRMGRGDVRTAILALLAEQPMHGYQIIREIEQRSGGSWKPSAGSVYPALQLLADEALISSEESDGRKTYSLTEAGREAAADAELPWGEDAKPQGRPHGALPKAGLELAQAATQVGRSGSPEQIAEAVEVLGAARRKLYAILAQE